MGQGYHLKACWAHWTTMNLILGRVKWTFLIGWQEGRGWIPGSEVHWKDFNVCGGLGCLKLKKKITRVSCCLATSIKINHWETFICSWLHSVPCPLWRSLQTVRVGCQYLTDIQVGDKSFFHGICHFILWHRYIVSFGAFYENLIRQVFE